MWAFLREINQQGTTIILTTHYLEEAENLCRHIAIINDGRTIESTAMKSLLKTLHIETFVLQLRDAIHGLPEICGYTLRLLDEFNLEVDIGKDKSINEVFIELHKQGVFVESMRNKTNRLEELFMNMVEQGRA